MPVDNSIYDTHASAWWQEDNFLYMLKTGLNPARFKYFKDILNTHSFIPRQLNILDVGCGGGFLSEEFAQIGCKLSAIDLSAGTINSAAQHAISKNLAIKYHVGSATALPFSTASFDIVICCDVLEHLESPQIAISESSRVLKPGGLFLFDTINRTLRSYFENILVAQELPFTRFFAPQTHAWRQFITPEELTLNLANHHFELGELKGLQPGIHFFQIGLEILKLKTGRSNYADFGRNLSFQTSRSTHGSYIGYAKKE